MKYFNYLRLLLLGFTGNTTIDDIVIVKLYCFGMGNWGSKTRAADSKKDNSLADQKKDTSLANTKKENSLANTKEIHTCDVNNYATHPEAVIVACYFNPQKSKYRKAAFIKFYETIKHCNHALIECVIGDADFELDVNYDAKRIRTKNLLWHKESLLNNVFRDLPKQYKYVFWLDGDILFSNTNWILDAVGKLSSDYTIIQPFEFGIHLDKDQYSLGPDIAQLRDACLNNSIPRANRKIWRSFGANFEDKSSWEDNDYDIHGHVGFAWGIRRDVLDIMGGLYDRCLIGGADHVMAHAAVGQINHLCIRKAFLSEKELSSIETWSTRFFQATQGKLGFVKGDLLHLWHGDLAKRQYLKRIQEFTPKLDSVTCVDINGLYTTDDRDAQKYINEYFKSRECPADEGDADASSGCGYYD